MVVLVTTLHTFTAAQVPNNDVAELSKTQIWSLMDKDRGPDLVELAPFSENGRSLTIPDYSQSDLLFRLADNIGLPPFKDDAIRLWTSKVPQTPRSQPLYGKSDLWQLPCPGEMLSSRNIDVAKWLSVLPDNDALASQIVENGTVRSLSQTMDPTTLTGMVNFWFTMAPLAIWSNDCDCRGNARQATTKLFSPDMSFGFIQSILYVKPSPSDPPEGGWVPGKQHSKDCSPRFFAKGRLQLDTYDKPSFLFPVSHDFTQAQFDMVADLLRNETAVSILETMRINRKVKDEVGLRKFIVSYISCEFMSDSRCPRYHEGRRVTRYGTG